MYYTHILASAKGGGRLEAPSLLLIKSKERVVRDRVIVAPVRDQYEELYKASLRLSTGESLILQKKEKISAAE